MLNNRIKIIRKHIWRISWLIKRNSYIVSKSDRGNTKRGGFWWDRRQNPRISTIVYDARLFTNRTNATIAFHAEDTRHTRSRASRGKLDSHLAECPATLSSKQLAWYTLMSLFAFFLSFCSTRWIIEEDRVGGTKSPTEKATTP